MYSSVKSQNSIPSRGLMNGNYVHLSSSPINNNTLQTYFQNRGKYHMSRQNPDVLDRMYASSNQQLQKISDNSVLNDGQSPVMIGPSGHTGTVHFTPPYQTTLLRQMLNARRLRSTPPSSLVELATMKGGRLLRKSVASPVVVKLAGVKRSNREESGRGKIVNGREQSTPNPCDKEVVLKALRQRRYERVCHNNDGGYGSKTFDVPFSLPNDIQHYLLNLGNAGPLHRQKTTSSVYQPHPLPWLSGQGTM